MNAFDTIAAVATPPGAGGIGIVRVSGPDSLGLVRRIVAAPGFSSAAPATHHLYRGSLRDPADGARIDDVLVVYMQAPASYTGEDVVEIHCHGGPSILQAALRLLAGAGARPAGPGEFTRRAFMLGRIDLSQAEAVMDLIGAASETALKQAARLLAGDLHNVIAESRTAIVRHLADCEAAIDFPEEAVQAPGNEDMLHNIAGMRVRLEGIARTCDHGMLCRRGVHAVIAGKPNVGKSSLFNLLTASDRAIVTPYPGTTRDALEAPADVGGMSLVCIDTAGIRGRAGAVERIGIERAVLRIADADLIIAVFDLSRDLDDDDCELVRLTSGKTVLPVCNKADLALVLDVGRLEALLPGAAPVVVSALDRRGLSDLAMRLHSLAGCGLSGCAAEVVISNLRHKAALESACAALMHVEQGLRAHVPLDMITIDLHSALQSLGEITGETAPEDVLNAIFSRFCIGK